MKRIVTFLLISAITFATFQPVLAQTKLSVRGSGRLYPIALPQLCLRSGQSGAEKEIPEVMARDLDLSGYFDVINPNAYIESPGKCGGPDDLAYSDWSVIGSEGLVRGVIDAVGNELRVELYLHDVQVRKVVLGKEYTGDSTQARRLAHRFANEIIKYFTGELGVFGTQISFSGKIGRFKELFVMDMDGSNVRQLTNDKGLAISSSWNPGGDTVVYTSYRNRMPDIFMVDPASRRIRQVTRGIGLEMGAQFTGGGRELLMSRSVNRGTELVMMNLEGTLLRQLSKSDGSIDVSPSWSPDYSQIAFCSNRAGGPQIYIMGADGSGARRISYVSSNYCTSPAWSPKGDRVAFVCRADGGFQLFTVSPDGSDPLQLTSSGDNEDPSWSPDGRMMVFATTFGRTGAFNLAIIRPDGSNMKTVTNSRGGAYEPAWGPLIP